MLPNSETGPLKRGISSRAIINIVIIIIIIITQLHFMKPSAESRHCGWASVDRASSGPQPMSGHHAKQTHTHAHTQQTAWQGKQQLAFKFYVRKDFGPFLWRWPSDSEESGDGAGCGRSPAPARGAWARLGQTLGPASAWLSYPLQQFFQPKTPHEPQKCWQPSCTTRDSERHIGRRKRGGAELLRVLEEL